MNQQHHFSQDCLLAKMDEADTLAATIRTLDEGIDRTLHIIRWAIVADEAMLMTTLAEEMLSEYELEQVRSRVNKGQPERWTAYRVGDRRVKALTGKELWEHPSFPLSLRDLFNNEQQKGSLS